MLHHHALAISIVLPVALIFFVWSSPWLTFISGALLKVACQCGFMQPTPAELNFDRQQGEVVPLCMKYKQRESALFTLQFHHINLIQIS